jgi:exopolysaccharide production protein ExoQ
MPPFLALSLTLAFIAFLFLWDSRTQPKPSGALWLPLLWMLLIGSRYVSEWLTPGFTQSESGLEEGSPIDRLTFLILIVAGLIVLIRRRVSLSSLMRRNAWLTIFLVYCLLAVTWSDFPFVALKRWLKVLGHPIMALIVLSDPFPEEALYRLMKRGAYVLIPVSILFIKYYPELGRGYESWTGQAMNVGVTTNKNTLGSDCMIFGVFFCCYLLRALGERDSSRRTEFALSVGFLFLVGWLFWVVDSQTAQMALIAGVVMMVTLGLRFVRRYAGSYLIVVVVFFAAVESLIGVFETGIQAVGRNLTLTDRTQIWDAVLKVDINPVVGAGFESFWLGERLENMWSLFSFHPVQAHNGYIETYLNLGLMGVFLLVCMLVAAFWTAKRVMIRNVGLGRFHVGLLLAIAVYNYAEASFKAMHLAWFAFYLIALDCQHEQRASLQVAANVAPKFSSHPRGDTRSNVARGSARSGPLGQIEQSRTRFTGMTADEVRQRRRWSVHR